MKRDPVCHIPPAQPQVLPNLQNLPQVPPATDLPSALAAIAAIRLIINQITNVNNTTNGPRGGGSGSSSEDADWVEDSRVSEKVRVYNPEDKKQYVDIQRINRLVMKNTKTKQHWQWDRKRGGG